MQYVIAKLVIRNGTERKEYTAKIGVSPIVGDIIDIQVEKSEINKEAYTIVEIKHIVYVDPKYGNGRGTLTYPDVTIYLKKQQS